MKLGAYLGFLERVEQCAALVGRQRLQERLEQNGGGVELAATPAGTVVEEFRPGDAEQEDRRASRQVGDVIEQVEEGRLTPVNVVEHHDEGPVLCMVLECSSDQQKKLI